MTENSYTTSLKLLFQLTIQPVSDIRNTSLRYAEYDTMLIYNAEVLVRYSTPCLSILGKDPYLLLSLLERYENRSSRKNLILGSTHATIAICRRSRLALLVSRILDEKTR